MTMADRAVMPCMLAMAIATGGCVTTIKGTTQRVAVVSDPIGATCTLSNPRMEAPSIVASTPGEAVLRRDSTPVEVNCSREGFLDVTERHLPLTGRRVIESQRRQVIVANALLLHLEADDGAPASAVSAAEGQRQLLGRTGAAIGVASVALPVTVGASLVPTLGGGAVAVGAGAVAALLLAGLIVAAPISLIVDVSSGAFNDYPTVMTVVMAPARFLDESTRDAWLLAVDRRLDTAAQAIREDTKADCIVSCAQRGEDDEAFIAEWRARVADLKSRTKIAAGAAPEVQRAAPTGQEVR